MGNQEMLIVAGLILTFWITIYHPFMVAVLIILLLWCLSHPNEVMEFFGNLTSSPNGAFDSNAPRMTNNNNPTDQSDPVYTQIRKNKFEFDPSKFQFNSGKSIMEQSVLPDDPSMSPSFYSEKNTNANSSDARGNGLIGSILERAVDNKAAVDPPRRKKSQREILAELAEEEERRKKYEKLLLTMQVPQMTDYFQEIINYEN